MLHGELVIPPWRHNFFLNIDIETLKALGPKFTCFKSESTAILILMISKD
jgi:hypothetical protein